jgi:hypothetical protein
MFSKANGVLIALLLPVACWCQGTSSDLSARTLYYREQPDDDKLPPVPQAKSARADKRAAAGRPGEAKDPPEKLPRGKQGGAEGGANTAGSGVMVQPKNSEPGTSMAVVIPAVLHLGLRYNLMVVDSRTRKAEPADPDRMFQPAECIQFEFEANRSGYLYVLEQGSSGRWQSLLPSAEMPDEANIVRSRSRVRVPANYCFEIEAGTPGIERVFVVLSRNVEDLYDLHESIKGSKGTVPPPAARPERTDSMLSAQNMLGKEIARMSSDLRSRDFRIKKIAQPEDPTEPPHSVYVVNASPAPSDRVVTEIRINHR